MEGVLRYLHTFATVCESGSITGAARRLNIAQPAISRQMRILEENVGVKLFDRDRDGIHLTPTGIKLREQFVPWLHDFESFVQSLAGEEGGGCIRFGTLTEAGQSFFMPHILRFSRASCDLEFEITYAKEFELKSNFKNGQLDAIVTTSAAAGRGVVHRSILRERSVVVARSSYGPDVKSAADFSYSRIVAYRQEDPLLAAYIRKNYPMLHYEDLNIMISVNSHRSMIDALLATDAIAVMPWQSVADQINAKGLRVVSNRELKGELYLSCKEVFADSRVGSRFIEHMSKLGATRR